MGAFHFRPSALGAAVGAVGVKVYLAGKSVPCENCKKNCTCMKIIDYRLFVLGGLVQSSSFNSCVMKAF